MRQTLESLGSYIFALEKENFQHLNFAKVQEYINIVQRKKEPKPF